MILSENRGAVCAGLGAARPDHARTL